MMITAQNPEDESNKLVRLILPEDFFNGFTTEYFTQTLM